jgi:hypothetical protein
MALILAEVYDAFRAANVPEEQARRAAAAVAGYEPQLADIRRDLTLLKWMSGTVIVLTIATLTALGGVYLRLIDLALRIPR